MFVSRLLASVLLLASSLPLAAETVFDYRFDAGPTGAPITLLLDSGPNALNGIAVGLNYSAGSDGGFAADTRGDGNYASAPSSPWMQLQTFTLSMDVRPSVGVSGHGAWPYQLIRLGVVKEFCNVCDSWGLDYDPVNGRFRGYIGTSINGLTGTGVDLFSSSGVVPGQLYTVKLSMARDVQGNLDSFSLYVDGQLQARLLEAFAPIAYGGDVGLYIGAGNLESVTSFYRRNFDGDIDNVQLLTTVVPEPGAALLLAVGLPLLLGVRRLRQ